MSLHSTYKILRGDRFPQFAIMFGEDDGSSRILSYWEDVVPAIEKFFQDTLGRQLLIGCENEYCTHRTAKAGDTLIVSGEPYEDPKYPHLSGTKYFVSDRYGNELFQGRLGHVPIDRNESNQWLTKSEALASVSCQIRARLQGHPVSDSCCHYLRPITTGDILHVRHKRIKGQRWIAFEARTEAGTLVLRANFKPHAIEARLAA